MKTLYIDHSIIAREENWQTIREAVATGKIRVVLSQWNLFEIASGTDRKQALNRADFLDSLKPLWAIWRDELLRQEQRAYVYRCFFETQTDNPQPFSDYLSVAMSYADHNGRALGYTVRRWIEETDVSQIQDIKQIIPDALRTSQSAAPNERKAAIEAAFKQMIGELLPDEGPDGKALTKEHKKEILSFCLETRNELLMQCPAFAVEYALSDIRTRDPSRNPKPSDTADLQHSVVALSYCDYFLVGDGYVRHFSEQLAKESPLRVATILGQPEDIPLDPCTCEKS